MKRKVALFGGSFIIKCNFGYQGIEAL